MRLHRAAGGRLGITALRPYIDDRTRESHIDMNGQNVIMDGEFTNHLQFPGDPAGEPAEVINCRCTIGYVPADDSFDMGRPDVNALND